VLSEKKTSIILAGGVAKGGFEVGALKVLAERGIPVSHVVAASSGALNGVLYAAAIRAGRENEAARRLSSLWLHDGDWMHAFGFDVTDLWNCRGLSTTDKLVQLMRQEVEPIARLPACRAVALTLIVASIDGQTKYIAGEPNTAFERQVTFPDGAFDCHEGRESIYRFAAASAAFPLLYAPVEIDGIGPCFDGGLVNNSPIGAAIDQGAERVILIAPSPAYVSSRGAKRGIGLVSQLAEILVGERLCRDLRQADRINVIVDALQQLASEGYLSADQLSTVQEVLGWKRRIELVCIRPPKELSGTAFSGFFDRGLRAEYIAAGRAAASAALELSRPA
jgi:NTE family protein